MAEGLRVMVLVLCISSAMTFRVDAQQKAPNVALLNQTRIKQLGQDIQELLQQLEPLRSQIKELMAQIKSVEEQMGPIQEKMNADRQQLRALLGRDASQQKGQTMQTAH